MDGILGGPVNVLAGARLTGTGRVGATTNQGVIAPGPRSGFGTLTIAGDYAGQGGGLEVRTRLGADNSPTDKLVITGATAGATPVTVKNIGGAGAATSGAYRSCRSMARRASSTWPTAITSSMGVRPWWPAPTAVLQQDPADGGWYLRSSLTDPGTPQPGGGNPGAQPPLRYQPGMPVYEAYANTLLQLSKLHAAPAGRQSSL